MITIIRAWFTMTLAVFMMMIIKMIWIDCNDDNDDDDNNDDGGDDYYYYYCYYHDSDDEYAIIDYLDNNDEIYFCFVDFCLF